MDFGLGFIPDLLRGKKFEDALATNAKQGAMAGLAMFGIPALGASGAAAGGGSGLTLGGSGAASGMGGGTGLLAGAGGAAGVAAPANALALSAPASSGGFMASLQPYMQAAGAASQVKGLLGDGGSQPIQAPQVAQGNPAGAQTLMQLYQQGTQMTPQDQARLQRKTMWG